VGDALLRILRDEASREARELRESAAREAARIAAEAAVAVEAAARALRERDAAALEARRRAAGEALAAERSRALLEEQRRILDGLRAEVARRLPAPAGAEVVGRLVAELARELSDGPFALVVDPGEGEVARAALERALPGAAARAQIRSAPAARGGVEARQGRCVLDDTLPARLARAWPSLEPELAALLFQGAREA